MYILQISDFHVNNFNREKINNKLSFLEKKLKSVLVEGDNVVCCFLGDFIEKGLDSYDYVADIIDSIKIMIENIVGNDHFALNFVPGNHDLCLTLEDDNKLSKFNDFLDKMGVKHRYSDDNLIYINNCFGYNFVNLCTSINAEHEFGQIDFEQLQILDKYDKCIINMHHSLISSDQTDKAVIRDGYKFYKLLESKDIITILHGHTHGFMRYTLGKKCDVIGVGPFLKNEEDISNQCNLIELKGNKIVKIHTFLYNADRMIWDDIMTYENNNLNIYNGNSVIEVYNSLLYNSKEFDSISNLLINITQDYESFVKEFENYFEEHIKKAEMWLSQEEQPLIPYTHGKYMSYKDKNWIEFVVDTLNRNPTSKRVIIPLLEKSMVFNNEDDNLISFDLIQISFDNVYRKNLKISVYFRALEVSEFLPINLSELYLIATNLKNHFKTIDNIEISFFAFKAEYKPNYACYEKKEIDIISTSKLCKLASDNDYKKIRTLIKEKSNYVETVIKDDWIIKLEECFEQFYLFDNREKVLETIQTIIELLSNIKDKRKKDSDYADARVEYIELNSKINELLDLIPS